MNWEENRAAAEHLEAERCELSFDFNELRRRDRHVLAIVERISVVPDLLTTGQMTPDEARATIADLERAVHLLDDACRLVLPRAAGVLHLVIGRGPDDVEPW